MHFNILCPTSFPFVCSLTIVVSVYAGLYSNNKKSFCLQADEIERILCHKFMRFMMMRAENFVVLRRKPVEVRNHDSDCSYDTTQYNTMDFC